MYSVVCWLRRTDFCYSGKKNIWTMYLQSKRHFPFIFKYDLSHFWFLSIAFLQYLHTCNYHSISKHTYSLVMGTHCLIKTTGNKILHLNLQDRTYKELQIDNNLFPSMQRCIINLCERVALAQCCWMMVINSIWKESQLRVCRCVW